MEGKDSRCAVHAHLFSHTLLIQHRAALLCGWLGGGGGLTQGAAPRGGEQAAAAPRRRRDARRVPPHPPAGRAPLAGA
jgi:hypothetical protein